jgi:hypothetical protein
MKRQMNKFFLLVAILSFSSLSFGYTLKEKLDYCATADSWAAQIILSELTLKGKHFDKNFDPDIENVTSRLINTEKMKDGDKPISFSSFGDLYIQTIMVIIPLKNRVSEPIIVVSTSIISPEECSLTRPSYINISM